jgi:hypothetical protein
MALSTNSNPVWTEYFSYLSKQIRFSGFAVCDSAGKPIFTSGYLDSDATQKHDWQLMVPTLFSRFAIFSVFYFHFNHFSSFQ